MEKRLIITRHAREQWLVRVVDPKRYDHLKSCEGCALCHTLLNNIHNILKNTGAFFWHQIEKAYNESVVWEFDDSNLKMSIDKKVSGQKITYRIKDNIVFPVSHKNNNDVLVSILTKDMIECFIKTDDIVKEEPKSDVFKTWKFACHRRNYGKVPNI